MKKQNSPFLFVLWLVLALLLAGCSPRGKPGFDCIPTDPYFSYPLSQWTADKPTPTVFPPEKNAWVLQSTDPRFENRVALIARGKDQIWLFGTDLLLYKKSNKQITRYDLEWEGEKWEHGSSLLARDGTLWVLWHQPEKAVLILGRYDDASDRFVQVVEITTDGTWGRMAEDSRGHIWIIVPQTGLFVFDPSSLLVDKIESAILDSDLIWGSISIDSKDYVWLGNYGENHRTTALYRYNPRDGIVETALLPEGVGGETTDIMADREGRIWIGDYGYWNTGIQISDDGYYAITILVRSTVFITERAPFHDYYWLRPSLIFEDSYGGIWYRGEALVRFDPQTGEWCKVFDGYAASAVQDNDGTFWVVNDGKIYSHN